MPKIGDTITFVPHINKLQKPQKGMLDEPEKSYRGIVDYVNEPHRYYRVRYDLERGRTLCECFKF